jgi:hypothetical protein
LRTTAVWKSRRVGSNPGMQLSFCSEKIESGTAKNAKPH